MRIARRFPAVGPAVLLVAVIVALASFPAPTAAQGSSRPIECPQYLTMRFLGLTEFRHAGHAWDTSWSLRMQVKPGQGYYVPPGQPSRIYSTDGKAMWFNPGILVACMEYVVELYVIEVHIEYWVEAFLGKVEELCDGGPEQEVDNIYTGSIYDPYDSGPESDGGGCAGTAEGGGTYYAPGEYTGGQMVEWETGLGTGAPSSCGDNAKVEWICIDKWDAELGKWVQWSCGYATTCG